MISVLPILFANKKIDRFFNINGNKWSLENWKKWEKIQKSGEPLSNFDQKIERAKNLLHLNS